MAGECFREVHVDFQSLPAAVLISDYNYANPVVPVAGQHAVSAGGHGQIHEYGYRVFTQGEAARLAEVKAQSIACRELTLHAVGNAMGLRAGHVFELEDGPADLPTRYLAIEVRHAGALGLSTPEVARYTGLDPSETYRVEVVAIPADVQFRAPQSTPWPRIYGFENAVIDGPADSRYAQIDEQGRYLSRFKFDTSDLPDGAASTHLRIMQPHGGTVEGMHFPLRKGTEVMVAFQGGDPDRPVIAGVVPNGLQRSTVTRANLTQNVLRSGGQNQMVMEDLDGKQHIDLFTPTGRTNVHLGGPLLQTFVAPPKAPGANPALVPTDFSYYVSTDGNAGFYVTGDWWQNVGGDLHVDVGGEATLHYVGVHTLNVDSDSNEFYNAQQIVRVGAGRTDTIQSGGITQDVQGGFTQTIQPGGSQTVTGNWTHKVTGKAHDDYGTWQTDVKGDWTAHLGGPWTQRVKKDILIESTDSTVTVKSPTLIVLEAPTTQLHAEKKWISNTPFAVETYGSKNSLGFQKLDIAEITLTTNQLKVETTMLSMGVFMVKAETAGAKDIKVGAAFSTIGVALGREGLKVASAGVRLLKAGLTLFS